MPSQRLPWVDVARGLCVLAVVLMHTTIWVCAPQHSPSPFAAGWRGVVDVMGAFRMPLLFAVSGLVVAGRVRRGWREPGNLLRVASTYYLYAVWLLVFGVVLALPIGQVHSLIDGPVHLLTQLALPNTLLWFVFALALWTAVLATLHRLDPRLVLAALALLSVTLAATRPDTMARDTFYYGLYFAIGVYGRDLVVRLVERYGVRLLAAGLPVFVLVATLHGSPWAADGVAYAAAGVLRECTGLVVGLGVVAALSAVPRLGARLAATGRRTLPLYVLHMPVLTAVHAVPAVREALTATWVTAVSPVLLTALAVAACLLLHRLLLWSGARWLFELPAPVRARLAPAPAPVPAPAATP